MSCTSLRRYVTGGWVCRCGPEVSAGPDAVGWHSPIAARKNTAGRFGFKSLIDAGTIESAQPSISKVDGVGEMLAIIDLCNKAGVKFTPHCHYLGHGLIATLHIIAAVVPEALVVVLWLDMEAHPFHDQETPTRGRLKVPQGAGPGPRARPGHHGPLYAKGEVTRVIGGCRS